MQALLAGPLFTALIIRNSCDRGTAAVEASSVLQEKIKSLEGRIGANLSTSSKGFWGGASDSNEKMYTLHSGGARSAYLSGVEPIDAVPILNWGRGESGLSGVIAHELIHLKHNDKLWMFVIPVIVSLVIGILVFPFMPPVLMYLCSLVSGIVSFILYSRFAEWRADKEACQYLNPSEKCDYLNWMKNLRSKQAVERNQGGFAGLLSKLKINADGDYRINILAPSLSSRIQLVELTIDSSKSVPKLRQ